jgi:hypothetical protein
MEPQTEPQARVHVKTGTFAEFEEARLGTIIILKG